MNWCINVAPLQKKKWTKLENVKQKLGQLLPAYLWNSITCPNYLEVESSWKELGGQVTFWDPFEESNQEYKQRCLAGGWATYWKLDSNIFKLRFSLNTRTSSCLFNKTKWWDWCLEMCVLNDLFHALCTPFFLPSVQGVPTFTIHFQGWTYPRKRLSHDVVFVVVTCGRLKKSFQEWMNWKAGK